jgi:hypothetical protein
MANTSLNAIANVLAQIGTSNTALAAMQKPFPFTGRW